MKDQEFHIEQRVGCAVVPPLRIEDHRDDLIRARDGYGFVMAVTPGDRKRCPECNYTLRVPVRDTWQIHCGYCALRGRQTAVVAGFWPLNDSLLDHLQKIDPDRDVSHQLAADADRRNQLLLESQENAAMAPGYAAAEDRYNRIAGIQQVGRTGKEHAWDHK